MTSASGSGGSGSDGGGAGIASLSGDTVAAVTSTLPAAETKAAEGGNAITVKADRSTTPSATVAKPLSIAAKSRVAAPAPVRIDTDADGYQYRRGEIIALDLDPAGLERVKELGYEVVSSQRLEGADVTLHVLRGPPEAAKALGRLRQASPSSTFALNHVFDPAADLGSGGRAPVRPPVGKACACRIGIVDTAVDPAIRELRRIHLVQRAFGGGEARPQAHGDAVAALIADQVSSGGAAGAGSELYVADMFSPGPQSGSAASLIGALSWLVQSGVPVINISLTGPPNPAVAKVVQNIVSKGVVLVAAAGNDGVAAPPAFPAAYPEVVAVTAVDRSRRPYHYANRGPYVMFAALGVDVLAGGPGDSPQTVSGTSFASPIVAVEVARRLSRADAEGARKALQALASEAVDLGTPGRDPIYGYGLIENRP